MPDTVMAFGRSLGAGTQYGTLAHGYPLHGHGTAEGAESAAQDSARLALLEALLDRLPLAVMAFDRAARPRILNQRARQILQRNDGLGLAHGHLVGGSPVQTAALRALLAAGPQDGRPPADTAFMITRPSGERPYNLMICQAAPGLAPGLTMLVTADPDQEAPINVQWLQKFYGLTPTEARLAREVGSGRTLNEASDTLGISIGTTRAHLKNIFGKTGTCRQAELVYVLLCAQAQILRPQS
ncbi:helix-turn-helix transcriptional regulator [Indioceanicola profundi]|uniref:helix-turn-helix transcriptional regulator n=1 Tax=Indioceanicola profundi TaxID=2220096 RepID=UPI000E6AD342|nr:helix-turn-helix transcriptional regulator [Indioceanicola profundi]